MTEEQKKAIIESGKNYFRTSIIPNHIKNLKKLRLKDFDINPFLINYLAAFLCGETTPQSMAKALVYPRILGTSVNTSFGQNIQIFISQLAHIAGCASGIGPGLRIRPWGCVWHLSVPSRMRSCSRRSFRRN